MHYSNINSRHHNHAIFESLNYLLRKIGLLKQPPKKSRYFTNF